MNTGIASRANRTPLLWIAIGFQIVLYFVLPVAWFFGAWGAAGGDGTPPPDAGHQIAKVTITIGLIALVAAAGICVGAILTQHRIVGVIEASCAALIVTLTVLSAVASIRSDNPAASSASGQGVSAVSAVLAGGPQAISEPLRADARSTARSELADRSILAQLP